MEQTLGKRIAQHRKELGMTQEKLAEALGVTAQAVSKWENDQSCPDIAIVPQLAGIFGITTDALLGREEQTVHPGQILEEDEPEGVHVQKGLWEFQYDGGRRSALFFALYILTVGVLTLMSRLLDWEVSFGAILWPSALLIFGIQGLCRRFSFFSFGSTLFGAYFLLDSLHIIDLDLGDMFFPALIILFGLSLLADALRKPKGKQVRFSRRPKNEKSRADCNIGEESFDCFLAFGDSTQYISLDRLSRGRIECSFGNLTVDLSGCEEVAAECRVDAECSFGDLRILVPSRYQVVPDSDTAFGDVRIQGAPDDAPQGKLRMKCDASFGQITVRYI